MALTRVCAGDPLMRTLREFFDANPLTVPDTRIQPLVVLAADGQRVNYFGHLSQALPGVDLPRVQSSALANMSAHRSGYASVETAISVLGALLTSLAGVPVPADQLRLAFDRSSVSGVSFSFPNPRRDYVDLGELGLALGSESVPRTPATAPFFDGHQTALLIDSVVLCREVAVSVRREDTASPALRLDPFGQLSLSTGRSSEMVMTGEGWLPLAFSCLRVTLSPQGTIARMIGDRSSRRILGWSAGPDELSEDQTTYFFAGEENELFALDD